MTAKPLFIYIGGPYSPPISETDPTKKNSIIETNINKANEVALEIAKKGHIPFVPHTMMRGWQDINGVSRDLTMDLCHKWVEKCDALYIIATSSGVELEKKLALKRNITIYRELGDVPQASPTTSMNLSPEAFQGYLTEYQECMDSYRHTYATIWQAGALFAAISAAIIAVAKASGGVPPLIQVLAPIPILFWYLGIFRPMNRYGELRNDRLAAIEQLLSEGVPGLEMHHFRDYSKARKEEGVIKRLYTFKWLLQPRVSEITSISGIALFLAEIYLLWKNYLS